MRTRATIVTVSEARKSLTPNFLTLQNIAHILNQGTTAGQILTLGDWRLKCHRQVKTLDGIFNHIVIERL